MVFSFRDGIFWGSCVEPHSDTLLAQGVNHLWLDVQWYAWQALVKLDNDSVRADILCRDLKGLLARLPGLEVLAFSDGTAFADEVTLNWINETVLDDIPGWKDEPVHGRKMAGTLDSTSSCPCRARFVPSMMQDTYEKGGSSGTSSTDENIARQSRDIFESNQYAQSDLTGMCFAEANEFSDGVFLWTETQGAGHADGVGSGNETAGLIGKGSGEAGRGSSGYAPTTVSHSQGSEND